MKSSISIEAITSDYGNAQIGRGAFGTINIAIHKSSRAYTYVALKSIRNAMTLDLENLSIPVFTELAALRILSQNGGHENVIPLLSVQSYESSGITFIFPYCPIDLHEILHTLRFRGLKISCSGRNSSRTNRLEDGVIRTILRDIVRGLEYCHSKGIIHCDVKPGNVLFNTSRFRFQLADFGLAQLTSCSVPAVGLCTLPYRSPEILFGSQNYETSMDMWGVGLILAEMLSGGRPLFHGTSVLDQLGKIIDVMGTPNAQSWNGIEKLPDFGKVIFETKTGVGLSSILTRIVNNEQLRNIMQKLLTLDPEKRPSAKACLQDEWMRGECSSRQYLINVLVPEDYISDEMRPTHDTQKEEREHGLEQMKLKAVEIAINKRKGLKQDDESQEESCPKVATSLPSLLLTKLKSRKNHTCPTKDNPDKVELGK